MRSETTDVRARQRHVLAHADPHPMEPGSDLGGLRVQFRVGELLRTARDRDAIRREARGVLEH